MISFKYFVVSVFLLTFQSAQGKHIPLNITNNFIVNGKPVDAPMPYHVSCQIIYEADWEHACSGAIISNRHVLSVAECFEDENPENRSIVAGTKSLKSGARYNLSSVIKHPRYVDHGSHNIAILQIARSFFWSLRVKPIEFRSFEVFIGNRACWVSGWGSTDPHDNNYPQYLSKRVVRTLDNLDCDRFWNVDDSDICAVAGKGRGLCMGDEGAPLTNIDETLLVGLGAFGSFPCALGLPDIYTRVSTYVNWIENILSSDS